MASEMLNTRVYRTALTGKFLTYARFFMNSKWMTILSGVLLYAAQCSHAAFFNLYVTNGPGTALLARQELTGFTASTQSVAVAFNGAIDVFPGDINQDGLPDLIGAGYYADEIVWWQNSSGGTSWTAHPVASGISKASAVCIADINGDSRNDIIGCAVGTDSVYWWENLDSTGTAWSNTLIASSFNNPFAVAAGTINEDPYVDVASVSSVDGTLTWWNNREGSGTGWFPQEVAADLETPMDVQLADLDADGDQDLITAEYGGNSITWHENLDGEGINWNNHTVATGFVKAYSVFPADVNGDGSIDLIGGAESGVIRVWYNDGNGSNWTSSLVDSSFGDVRSVWGTDMDSDGDVDVAAAGFGSSQVAWWENRADGTWRKWTAASRFTGARSVCAADFNLDGTPDLAGAAFTTNQVACWLSTLTFGLSPYEQLISPESTNQVSGGKSIACAMANSPITAGTTREVCTGWQGSGSMVSGTGTNTGGHVIHADSGIEWLWGTQFWLQVSSDSHGLTTQGSEWMDDGSVVSIEAISTDPGYSFVTWLGAPSGMATNNPLILTNDKPHSIAASFSMVYFTIEASAGEHGSISPTGVVQVAFGGGQSFSITPDPGYQIASILIDGEVSGVSDYIEFINVQQDHTLRAEFEHESIALKVNSPFGSANPVAGKTHFYDGGTTTSCSIVDSPIPIGAVTQLLCYGWSGTGDVPPSGSGVSTPSFTLTDYSTITWLWRTQTWLEVSQQGFGTTDVTSSWFDVGSEARLTATPTPGSIFTEWQGDVPENAQFDNPLTIDMDRAKTLTALFSSFKPTIQAAAGNHGTITPSGEISVEYLSQPEFIITPDDGYRVASVNVDGVPVGYKNPYTFDPIVANHSIVASFTKDTYELNVQSAYGTPDPASGTNVLQAGSVAQCSQADAIVTNGISTQYVCTGWSGSGAVPASGTTLQTGLLLMNQDSTINWLWSTQYWLDVSANAGGSLNTTSSWQAANTLITLTATPDTGYSFTEWTGEVGTLDRLSNPLIFLAQQARSLQANFTATVYSITASADSKGSITPTGTTSIAYGKSQTYTIAANNGYRIDDVLVDDVSVGTPSSYTFTNVVSNHTISASFTLDYFNLTVSSPHGTPDPNKTTGHQNGSSITCTLAGSPETMGLTQYLCTGWSGTGSAPASGTRTNTDSFAITNTSTLNWNWTTNYRLEVAAEPFGRVSRTGEWVAAGITNVSIEAKPDNGYRFAGWQGDVPQSLTNSNPLSLDMDQGRSILARFDSNYVIVTVSSTGSGSVSPGNGTYPPNTNATFFITPSSGSRIHSLLVDGTAAPISNYYAMSYTFTNLIQDHTLAATFGADSFDLTIASPFGTVAPPVGTHTYYAGEYIQCSLSGSPDLTATGRTRRIFTYWSGSGSLPENGTNTTIDVTVQDDSTLTWNWKTQQLLQVETSGSGTISVPDEVWHDAGSAVPITATPDMLYRFEQWTGDVPAAQATNNPLSITMDQPRNITAVFAPEQVQLTVSSSHGTAEPAIGSHSYSYGTAIYAYIPQSPFPTNAAGTQFVCTGWAGSGSVPSTGTATNTGSISLTRHSSIDWLWQTNYQLTASALGGGEVATDGSWFAADSSAKLTATPHTGYLFAGWNGAPASADTNSNPLSITMDQARTLTAVFVTNQPVLSVYSTYNTVLPSVGTHTSDYAAVITCEAATSTVTEGTTRYVCSGWTGSGCVPSTGATLSIDVLMTNNSSITWQWKRQYLLSATGGVNGSVTPTSVWHDNGETATVLAIADNGYQFSGWSGDVGFADTNQNPLTLTMDQARSVFARFIVLRPTLTISNPHGTCSPEPGTYTTHQQGYSVEALVYQTPFPSNAVATQYVCTGWTGTGSAPASGTNIYTQFALQTNSSVNWTWTTQFWLKVSAGPNGSVNPTGGWYDANTAVTVTPTTASAHTFDHWSGDLPLPTMVYDNPIVITMNQSRALSAFFTTNQPVLTVRSTYGTPDPAVGSHTGAYARTVHCFVDCDPISIGTGTQIVQRGWTGSGSIPASGTACSLTATLTNDSELIWQWSPQFMLSVTSGPGGSVQSASGWQDAGSNLIIRANPDEFTNLNNGAAPRYLPDLPTRRNSASGCCRPMISVLPSAPIMSS